MTIRRSDTKVILLFSASVAIAIAMVWLAPYVFPQPEPLNAQSQDADLTKAFILLGIGLLCVVFVLIYKFSVDKHLKVREQKVASNEYKFSTLVSALREGIVQYDMEGNILFANEGFSRLTGFPIDELIGSNILHRFIKEEDWDKYRNRYRERKQGKYEEYEDSIRTKTGEFKFVSILASPVPDETGTHATNLATVIDITEKKKQIEDLEAFSASAAHDINAPLARIEMIAMLLLDDSDLKIDGESLELLQAITGITSNLRTMLKDLLDFSRLGVSGITRKVVDTDAIVREVVAATQDINPKAQVIVHPLPKLHGDPIMFKQVFVNLIGNALKYSSHQESPRVEIGSYRENNANVIFVQDNGAGFSMAYYHKLFAAFQRLHVEFEGNGLGLPIVKRIIEKHGGRIWAEGAEGLGATFYFTIP